MAKGQGINQGKTAFLEEFLPDNRDANLDAVNKAWAAAGNEGTVSESLFGKIRSKLGLTGKRGPNGVAAKEDAGPSAKGKARSSPKGTRVKGASKAEKVPTEPDGPERGTGPNRSAFVEEALQRNPKSNVRAINDAWKTAGNEGKISDTIFYKVKRERGRTGEDTPATPAKSKPESVSEPPEIPSTVEGRPEADGASASAKSVRGTKSRDRERVLDRVEDGIDDLIIELKQLGGMEEALESLKKARRVVVRSHEG
jgi:hypothetical protein